MESDNNVIDLKSRMRTEKGEESSKKAESDSAASVTDISQIRTEIIAEERRKVKRTILTEFIGANVVIPGIGLQKVSIYDISEGGIAFDIEESAGQFNPGEEVAMRVYMNHKTYFPFTIKVNHVSNLKEDGVYRHGANFIKDTVNDKAMFHFVKFIENISAALRSDRGDVMVSNIK